MAEKRKGKVVEFYNYDDVRIVRSAGTDPKNPKCWTRTNVTQSQVRTVYSVDYCTSVPQNILVRRRRIAHDDQSAKVSSQALNGSNVVIENAKHYVRISPFIRLFLFVCK